MYATHPKTQLQIIIMKAYAAGNESLRLLSSHLVLLACRASVPLVQCN